MNAEQERIFTEWWEGFASKGVECPIPLIDEPHLRDLIDRILAASGEGEIGCRYQDGYEDGAPHWRIYPKEYPAVAGDYLVRIEHENAEPDFCVEYWEDGWEPILPGDTVTHWMPLPVAPDLPSPAEGGTQVEPRNIFVGIPPNRLPNQLAADERSKRAAEELERLIPPPPSAGEGVGLYRKKPVVIEAMCLKQENISAVVKWCGGEVYAYVPATLTIHTLEGDHTAGEGDYIIRGIRGEFYPCKPDIFSATYEAVDTPPPADAKPEKDERVGEKIAERLAQHRPLLDAKPTEGRMFPPPGESMSGKRFPTFPPPVDAKPEQSVEETLERKIYRWVDKQIHSHGGNGVHYVQAPIQDVIDFIRDLAGRASRKGVELPGGDKLMRLVEQARQQPDPAKMMATLLLDRIRELNKEVE